MDNFDLKKYLSNNPLLNEIKVNEPSGKSFPEKHMDDLNTLTEGYLEGSSPEGILNPEGETYSEERFSYYIDDEDEEDDEQLTAFKNIINNIKPGIYLIKNWFGFSPAPGAPSRSYDTKVTITTDKEIKVDTVPMDNDNGGSAGWFDSSGKYHPDLKHFNENGDRIYN